MERFVGLSSFLLIFGLFVNVSLPPFPALSQCDGCLEDCMGADGLVAGIGSQESVILSRDWLSQDQFSIQHNADVNS